MGKREEGEKGKEDVEKLIKRVIGCCIRVHSELGPGFLESAYHRALELELAEEGIPFETQKEMRLSYRGHFIGEHHLDLFIDGMLVVELKTVENIGRDHYAQVKSYLKAIEQRVGLLVNFAGFRVDVRRVELKVIE